LKNKGFYRNVSLNRHPFLKRNGTVVAQRFGLKLKVDTTLCCSHQVILLVEVRLAKLSFIFRRGSQNASSLRLQISAVRLAVISAFGQPHRDAEYDSESLASAAAPHGLRR
jgi:hypothetical protein